MSNLHQAHAAYKATRRQNNAALWGLCIAVYYDGRTWAEIARELQEDEKTIRNFGMVGEFIVCVDELNCKYFPPEGPVTLADMWQRDALTFDHLLRAAKWYRAEVDPADLLEMLYNAMTSGQSAAAMELDIEDAHGDIAEVARRSAEKVIRVLSTHLPRLDDPGVQEAALLLQERIKQAYQ